MAHIVDFSIAGLAGRDDVYARTLDRHVNVFFGLNGTGKTSLLRVLDSAMSGDASRLGRVPFLEARVTICSESSGQNFTRSLVKPPELQSAAVKRVLDAESHAAAGTRPHAYVIPGPGNRMGWSAEPGDGLGDAPGFPHRFLQTSRSWDESDGDELAGGKTPAGATDSTAEMAFAASIHRAWRRYSLDVLRETKRAQEDGLAGILRTVLAPGHADGSEVGGPNGRDPEEAYSTVKQFLERQGSHDLLGTREESLGKYRDDPALQKVVADIEQVEKRIEEAAAPSRRLEETIGAMFSSSAEVSFSEESIDAKTRAGESIGLVSLSSGEKHILRLLVEAMLTGENTLLIDEPELSLHVDWQRRLIATMLALNPEAQYVLATHSPEIMADVPDERVFRM